MGLVGNPLALLMEATALEHFGHMHTFGCPEMSADSCTPILDQEHSITDINAHACG
jgi:hypothetical protein